MGRTKKDRVFSVVTVNGTDGGTSVEVMSEPQLLAWLANNPEHEVRIFEGTEFRPNTSITLEPVTAPEAKPPKRKYERKPKAAPVAPKITIKDDSGRVINGAGEKAS